MGHEQATAAAEELAAIGPLPVVTSPLRRTRETAAAFESQWDLTATIEPAVGEINAPTDELAARTAWLRDVLTGERRWSELDDERRRWRDGVLAALGAIDEDAVVVSHFIAINAAVGAATGDDHVVGFKPDYCSCTTIDVEDGSLTLVELGREAATTVRTQ